MPSGRQFPPVLAYAAAIAIPIAIGIGWPYVDALIRGVPGYVSVVAVALIARFLGLGPAMAATLTLGAVLWFHVWPVVFPGWPLEFRVSRLLLFSVAAAILASLSRQTAVAVQQLDETSRRMRALFDASIDAILWADSTGRYVDANPAASTLLGYTREEIVTMRAGDFSLPQHKQEMLAAWNEVLLHRGRRGEISILRKDGQTRAIEYVAVSDVLPGFHCAFMHDITARKEAERSVRSLSARLLHLQDEERRRIARQLHDTTGQNLTAIRLILARAQGSPAAADPAIRDALAESVALTEESIGEIRTLAYLLHPPMIEDAGLVATLRWFAKAFESRSGIAVTLELPEGLARLPIKMETTIFRIVQEALSNIQRHSGSAVAAIRLERRPDALELRIEDKGRGIPAHLRGDDLLLAASGVGIAGIRERARELGGRMDIQSHDGGTVVTVTVPLPEN
jgi:PAS domain S-box-containing protein